MVRLWICSVALCVMLPLFAYATAFSFKNQTVFGIIWLFSNHISTKMDQAQNSSAMVEPQTRPKDAFFA